MAITVEKALLNNQSILQNFGLVEEINEQSAEIISGGVEVFTIRNATPYSLDFTMDGTLYSLQSGSSITHTTYYGGQIQFDNDRRVDYYSINSYDLEDGKIYDFHENFFIYGNPYGIDLYRVI